MLEFARHEFRLGQRGKDGKSLRETLETVARMTGRMPEEGVNPVELPPETNHVWAWFLDLNAARQSGLAGGLPLSHAEMAAFFGLERITPNGWELQALRALDRVALTQPEAK